MVMQAHADIKVSAVVRMGSRPRTEGKITRTQFDDDQMIKVWKKKRQCMVLLTLGSGSHLTLHIFPAMFFPGFL